MVSYVFFSVSFASSLSIIQEITFKMAEMGCFFTSKFRCAYSFSREGLESSESDLFLSLLSWVLLLVKG